MSSLSPLLAEKGYPGLWMVSTRGIAALTGYFRVYNFHFRDQYMALEAPVAADAAEAIRRSESETGRSCGDAKRRSGSAVER